MEIPCVVRHIQYKNDSGFAVLACEIDPHSSKYTPEINEMAEQAVNEKYQTFSVSLNMFDHTEDPIGGQYIFSGEFVNNPKFGLQFKAEFYYQDVPSTVDGLQAYLMSLPNIKESRSMAIIKEFGVDGAIDVLENRPDELLKIKGINEKRLQSIVKSWSEKKYMRELFTWLTAHKIPMVWADKIFKMWGKQSLKILSENPYRLVEIHGIGFVTADKIAHKIIKDIPLDHRITACIKYVIEENTWNESNLCIPYSDLKKSVLNIITKCDEELGKKDVAPEYIKQVPISLKNNLKLFGVVKDKVSDSVYVYLKTILEKERYIAKQLWERKEIHHHKIECSDIEIEDSQKNISEYNNREIVLDDSQKKAIKSAFENKTTIITGGAGSGKSTICRAIFYLAQKKGLSIRMMSPTGKAAQVLTGKTGCGAATIHRSLNMKPGEDVPKNKIREDIIIIDEVSMCGIDTIFPVLSAMQENLWGNIILVGDKNQLPSVSPGNFLSDMISSGIINVVELDKVHRQDEKSYISILANEISKGKVVSIPSDAVDIRWNNIDPDSFEKDLLDFVGNYLSENKSMDDLQIISPMKKGMCGVYKINEIMQKEMAAKNNTEDKFVNKGFLKFHQGDKVIQVVNNYDKMIFNGDCGKVIEVGEKPIDASVSDKAEKYIVVDFYGDKITYFGDDLDELQLGWALTVHKMQGSQSKEIVFIMAGEAQIMMSKELVYTAFSRAEKMLTIFGHNAMLRIAPTKSAVRKRYTNLNGFINEYKNGIKKFEILK